MILTLQWPAVIKWSKHQDEKWIEVFALSIARNGRRKSWFPTRKQQWLIGRLLKEQQEDTERLVIGRAGAQANALIER